MSAAKKQILNYIPRKTEKIPIPARVYPETVKQAQAAAKKMGVPLTDFIEGAIRMAVAQAGEK